MPIRIQHIHKHHQPGDLASFSDAESGRLVRAGIGTVEDPATDAERELFELQKTLPPVPVPGRVAEIVARPETVAPVPDRQALVASPDDSGAGDGDLLKAPTLEAAPAPKEAAPVAKEPVRPGAPAAARDAGKDRT